ncbi:hypothetical protein [Verrucomicrobium sp. BvORR106]|uniref:hypothetical protein n=1 Tax=Verrucomicrobium sp. BvORR106 TaxID=1403819 RepID=UPI0005704237|nr:hypothetical protein [Verrucomicrobium sp. BvORR106]
MNTLVRASLLAICVALGTMTSSRSFAGPVPYQNKRPSPAAPRVSPSVNDETGTYASYFRADPLSALAIHHEPRLIVPNDGLCGWGATHTPGLPIGMPSQFAVNFDEIAMHSGLVALWPVFMERYGGLWFESLYQVEDDTLPSFPPPRVWIGQEDFGSRR